MQGQLEESTRALQASLAMMESDRRGAGAYPERSYMDRAYPEDSLRTRFVAFYKPSDRLVLSLFFLNHKIR